MAIADILRLDGTVTIIAYLVLRVLQLVLYAASDQRTYGYSLKRVHATRSVMTNRRHNKKTRRNVSDLSDTTSLDWSTTPHGSTARGRTHLGGSQLEANSYQAISPPVTGQPVTGHLVTGQPVTSHLVISKPVTGQDFTSHPVNGQSGNSQPSTGQLLPGTSHRSLNLDYQAPVTRHWSIYYQSTVTTHWTSLMIPSIYQ